MSTVPRVIADRRAAAEANRKVRLKNLQRHVTATASVHAGETPPMNKALPNWATCAGLAAVLALFFLGQHFDNQDAASVDAAVVSEARHAAADVAHREKVELAMRMAERDTP